MNELKPKYPDLLRHPTNIDITTELLSLKQVKTRKQLIEVVEHLHWLGADAFFKISPFSYGQVHKGPVRLEPSALAMSDPDLYLRSDGAAINHRTKFLAYVEECLLQAGHDAGRVATDATAVLSIEARLAGALLPRANSAAVVTTVRQFAPRLPSVHLLDYFARHGGDGIALEVIEPNYFTELNEVFFNIGFQKLLSYVRFQLVHFMQQYEPPRSLLGCLIDGSDE